MERGYFKVYRKLLDSPVFMVPDLLQLWIYCLGRANHKERNVPLKTGKGIVVVNVKKGQFIFGRKSVSEFMGQKESTTYKRLKKLEEIGNVTIQPNRHYSIITICNWELYQTENEGKEQPTGTPVEQPRNSQGTAKEQPGDTNKHYDHCENDEKVLKDAPIKKNKSYKTITEPEFIQSLEQYNSQYPKSLIEEFFEYWSEPTPTGKMKFQTQQTWDTKRRLKKWANNSEQWGNNKQGKTNKSKSKSDKIDDALEGFLNGSDDNPEKEVEIEVLT